MAGTKNKIKAVLLDLDGTLIDIRPRFFVPIDKALKQIKTDYDKTRIKRATSNIIMSAGGKSKSFMLRIFWDLGRYAGLNILQRIKFMQLIKSMAHEFRNIVPFRGVDKTLRDINSLGLDMAIVTSASLNTVNKVREKIEALCLIKHVVHRGMVKKVKPHPESLVIASQLLNIPLSECVMVGDLPLDIIAAKAAGAISVTVLGPMAGYTEELVRKHKPNFMINDLSELTDVLIKLI